MINPKTLFQLAACSVSLPTFAASPSVAKATVYMPSSVAAQRLGNAQQFDESTISTESVPQR